MRYPSHSKLPPHTRCPPHTKLLPHPRVSSYTKLLPHLRSTSQPKLPHHLVHPPYTIRPLRTKLSSYIKHTAHIPGFLLRPGSPSISRRLLHSRPPHRPTSFHRKLRPHTRIPPREGPSLSYCLPYMPDLARPDHATGVPPTNDPSLFSTSFS